MKLKFAVVALITILVFGLSVVSISLAPSPALAGGGEAASGGGEAASGGGEAASGGGDTSGFDKKKASGGGEAAADGN